MKHDPEMIERVARAIADTQHTRYWEVWKETAQDALDVAFEWRDIETAPRDAKVLMWGRSWHWGRVEFGYFHTNYNGHKDVVSRDGPGGAPFRVGDDKAPTHWLPLPTPPEED